MFESAIGEDAKIDAIEYSAAVMWEGECIDCLGEGGVAPLAKGEESSRADMDIGVWGTTERVRYDDESWRAGSCGGDDDRGGDGGGKL